MLGEERKKKFCLIQRIHIFQMAANKYKSNARLIKLKPHIYTVESLGVNNGLLVIKNNIGLICRSYRLCGACQEIKNSLH